METSIVEEIKTLFHRKIMLYDDLLHSLREERDSLIQIDLDALWRISKEKEKICLKIASIRQEIISGLSMSKEKNFSLNGVMESIPREFKSSFHKLILRLIKLKREIDVLRKENMIYINDSLQFLDEMISILKGETASNKIYNKNCHLSPAQPRLTINMEA